MSSLYGISVLFYFQKNKGLIYVELNLSQGVLTVLRTETPANQVKSEKLDAMSYLSD